MPSLLFSKKLLVFLVTPILFGLIFYSSPPEIKADSATTSISIVVSVCGDGIVGGTEECDGSNLNGESCTSQGYDSGTLSCAADCTFDTSGCSTAAPTGGGGGGGGTIYVPPATKVVLQGKAYPQANITVLKDGQVVTIITADSQANFKVELTTITAGTYTFGVWAEDKEGRKSITFSFTATVTKGMTTTISNIIIPPTVALEKNNVLRGETFNIFGQTVPKSEVSILIASSEITKKTAADEEGDWDLLLDTSPLDEGYHTVRAKTKTPDNLLSSYSKVLAFYVGKYGTKEVCPRADFNKDGKTNLIDFSIMLYWWGKYNPCADQNQDGIVNLPDFSILMYWWTG
jgi:hypothetical protein